MSKIAFITLGCKLNYAETSTYERALVDDGWTVVPWTRNDVDFYLVNTCSVTEHSDKKSRNIIRKLHRTSQRAGIVVTGCSAQLRRSEIEAIEGVVRVFGATEKSLVVPFLKSLSCSSSAWRQLKPSEGYFRAYSSGERTRSFLKVQDGCSFKCAYCTVPYARGESRCAPIADVIEDAGAIAAKGIKEIVITGVNTGDFGRTTGETFFDLVKALNGVDGIERYRISSIEPNLLTEEIVDWIASGTKFLPHFHIPLQSGCDEILKRMGRRYLTADFAAKIAYIRSAMERPGTQKVFFGIDVIVGFPGETDEMFQRTYDFLENEVKPSFIHIFPYSKRPGTPAAEFPDQVQDSVKTKRVEALERLSERLHEEFVKSNAGLRSKVLFEQKTREGMACGWSENYIRVERPWEENIVGNIIDVTL